MSALHELFIQLNQQLQATNYAKAIDICNQICQQSPNDPDALKTKCVCYLRTGKFEKALQVAKSQPHLQFEAAYCQYRLKNLEAVFKITNSIPGDKSRAVLHLEAQTHYRMNNFEKSAQIYEELIAESMNDDEIIELNANLLAAYTAAGYGQKAVEYHAPEAEDTYEIAFNKACGYLQQNQYAEAGEELRKAEGLCRELLTEEGLSEDQIQDEMAVILVQMAFAFHMCGETEKALTLYRQVLHNKPKDAGVVAVATNNIVALRHDKDIFDSIKRFKGLAAENLEGKLLPSHQLTIASNRAVLLCMLNKGKECREALEALQQGFPSEQSSTGIMAALLFREKKLDECIDLLKSNPASAELQLMLAHVYMVKKQPLEAAQVIEKISAIRHRPATVATLVALYSAANDDNAGLRVLGESLKFNSDIDPLSDGTLRIREGSATLKLSSGNYRDAARAYAELIDGDCAASLDSEARLRSLASMVVALSYFDPENAEVRGALLPPLEDTEMDVEELEANAPRVAKARVSRLMARVAGADDKKQERKRRAQNPEKIARKRARRREKYIESLKARPDYNASIGLVRPDAERWIPRKQRSFAKRGRRGRNKFVGAQGSGMGGQKDAAKLDAAARAAARKDSEVEEKKAQLATSKASAVQRKSKKKKRR